MESAALQESIMLDGPVNEGSTVVWQAEENKEDNASSLCEDLEKLVETGYYELIQTGYTNSSDKEGDGPFFEVIG